jgi:hypothetical protein
MGPTVRLRPRAARALGALMVLAAVAGLVSLAVGDLATALRLAAPVVLFGLLGWAAFWEPYVEVADGGVRIANTLRTVMVPWPAVEEVEGRYGLRLRTAYGSFTAWAAQAPAGRQRARGLESEAARLVRERLETLRQAGHLDNPRLERPEAQVTWHRARIAAVAGLALATLLLPLV